MSFRCSRKWFFFLILGAASFQSTKAGTQRFTSNPSLRLHRCAQHLGVKREHWVKQGASLEQVLWKLHSNITQIQSWPQSWQSAFIFEASHIRTSSHCRVVTSRCVTAFQDTSGKSGVAEMFSPHESRTKDGESTPPSVSNVCNPSPCRRRRSRTTRWLTPGDLTQY